MAGFRHVGVFGCEGVASATLGFFFIDYGYTPSPHYILYIRNTFEMVRIDAAPVPAQMVDCHFRWYLFLIVLEGQPVDVHLFSLASKAESEEAIAFPCLLTEPLPTAVRDIDLRYKPRKRGHIHGRILERMNYSE